MVELGLTSRRQPNQRRETSKNTAPASTNDQKSEARLNGNKGDFPSVVKLPLSRDAEKRFDAFLLTPMAKIVGHADRVQPLHVYCKGLLGPATRKNIEQIAASMTEARNLHSVHQSLHHFIATAAWDDDALLRRVHAFTSRQIEAAGQHLDAWAITDVGLIKKGKETVGITRKYCARQERRVNCQSGVMVLATNDRVSLPVCLRLYLPESWTIDAERRRKAGIPDYVEFANRPNIAIEQIRRTMTLGLPPKVVVANDTYGGDPSFHRTLSEMKLRYLLQAPGTMLVSPKQKTGSFGATSAPVTIKVLARALPSSMFRSISFRTPGGQTTSHFAAVRVSHFLANNADADQEKWLVVQRSADKKRPEVYWLSTLPESSTTEELAKVVARLWSAEIGYLDLKDHLGLGHYEGRGWRGFHHHAALCIAVYGFLISEFVRSS